MSDYLMLYLMGRLWLMGLMLKVTHLGPTKHPHLHQGPLWREERGRRQDTSTKTPHVTLPSWPP